MWLLNHLLTLCATVQSTKDTAGHPACSITIVDHCLTQSKSYFIHRSQLSHPMLFTSRLRKLMKPMILKQTTLMVKPNWTMTPRIMVSRDSLDKRNNSMDQDRTQTKSTLLIQNLSMRRGALGKNSAKTPLSVTRGALLNWVVELLKYLYWPIFSDEKCEEKEKCFINDIGKIIWFDNPYSRYVRVFLDGRF